MKPFISNNFYEGEGVLYEFVNNYESRQNPNMIHLTNTFDFHTYFRYFLQRVQSLIIFDNFPSDWDEDYFTTMLYLSGNVAIIKSFTYGAIPQHGSPWGFNVYYKPTHYLVSNPALKSEDNTQYEIGKTCEIVHLTSDWCGIADLINSYAQRVAMILSDIDVATALAKFGYIFTAKNKATSETFKTAFDDIMSGKLAVAVNQGLYDKETGKELFNYFNNDIEKNFNVVQKALDSLATLKHTFDMEIGLYTPNDKKERMITSEVDEMQNGVTSKCELWVETLNKCWDKVNKMFGTNISCRLRNGRSEDIGEGNSSDSNVV